MKKGHSLIVILTLAVVFAMDIVMAALLMQPRGIRMHAPLAGLALPLETTAVGDAWMKGGVAAVEVRVRDRTGAPVLAVHAVRDAVKDRGRTLALLAAWRAPLSFPADGRYALSALVTGTDGTVLETPWRQVTASASARSGEFVFGSPAHIIPLVLFLVLCIAVPVLVRRAKSELVRDRVALAISIALLVHEVLYEVYWFAIGSWTVGNCMHLHMCSLALAFLPLFYFTRGEGLARRFLFEMIFFFGLGGAMQALFTPDIGMHGFPELKYFNYFFSHGTIVLGAVYAAALYGIPVTWKSWIRIAAGTLAMSIAMFGVNRLLAVFPPYEVGNYFIMGYPPPTGSVIDVFASIFGPAPWYLAGLALMGLALLAVLTLPYSVKAVVRWRRAAAARRVGS
jgi:hypothetical integral membrane protein (TIGR02206 family)